MSTFSIKHPQGRVPVTCQAPIPDHLTPVGARTGKRVGAFMDRVMSLTTPEDLTNYWSPLMYTNILGLGMMPEGYGIRHTPISFRPTTANCGLALALPSMFLESINFFCPTAFAGLGGKIGKGVDYMIDKAIQTQNHLNQTVSNVYHRIFG